MEAELWWKLYFPSAQSVTKGIWYLSPGDKIYSNYGNVPTVTIHYIKKLISRKVRDS